MSTYEIGVVGVCHKSDVGISCVSHGIVRVDFPELPV